MNPTPRAERLPTATPRERREAVVRCTVDAVETVDTFGEAVGARFWAKVDKSGECWLWTATLTHGYGAFRLGKKMVYAHRWAYGQYVGELDPELVIDHICETLRCVRPNHLRQITNRANILRGNGAPARNARKTHCKSGGHPLSGSNLYVSPNGKRHCRTCRRLWRIVQLRPMQQEMILRSSDLGASVPVSGHPSATGQAGHPGAS